MGTLFPPGLEQDQGGTGQRRGMSQVSHRPALSSPSPSLPAFLHGPLPLTPTQTTDLPLAPSLGSSVAWGSAAVVGAGLRMTLGTLAGVRCPLKMTALFGGGSLLRKVQFCLPNLSGHGTPVQGAPCLVLALGLPQPCLVPSGLSPIEPPRGDFLATVAVVEPRIQDRLSIKISCRELTPDPGLSDSGPSFAGGCVT